MPRIRQESADDQRDKAWRLYTMGMSVRQIARDMHLGHSTVHRMLQEADVLLQMEALPGLSARLRKSVEVRKHVQLEAWAVSKSRSLANNSMARIGALQTILAAQEQIDRLEGTTAPDSANSAAVAEFVDLMIGFLHQKGGAELQAEFLELLSQQIGGTSRAPLLGSMQDLLEGQEPLVYDADEVGEESVSADEPEQIESQGDDNGE